MGKRVKVKGVSDLVWPVFVLATLMGTIPSLQDVCQAGEAVFEEPSLGIRLRSGRIPGEWR